MKRAVVLCLAVTAFAGVPSTRPASAAASPELRLMHLSVAQAHRHLLATTTRRIELWRNAPAAHANAPDRQDPGLLALPDAAFKPATLVPAEVGVESNAVADAGPFSVNHSKTYTALARVTGFFQRANWQPSGQTDTAVFRYQASVFKTSDAAHAAWQDGVTHTPTLSNIAMQDCTSQLTVTCSYGGYALQDGSVVVYFAMQFNQCLAETSGQLTQALYTAQQTQIAQTLGTVTADAVVAMQAACGVSTPNQTIAFNLVALAVRAHDNVTDPTKKSLSKARRGQTVYLYFYYTIQNAPANVTVADTVNILRNGTLFAAKSYPHTLQAPPPNNYYDVVTYKVSKKGKYTFTGRLTVGDQAQEASVHFTVKK